MYKPTILIGLVICSAVNSDICASNSGCLCIVSIPSRDGVKEEDFLGDNVDCSFHSGDLLGTKHTLPTTVYSLNLSSNNITQLVASTILKSATLVELYLNKNAITEVHSKVLMFPELKILDLSNNHLHYIDKEAFRDITKLEYLNLANNRLTHQDSLALHRLSNLNELILDNNDLGSSLDETNLFDRSGYGLTAKIKSLSISGVNLNFVPENFFSDAYDIRKLIVSRNNLTEIFELPFTLEYLDLSDNPIKEISEEDFSDLPGLKVLKLNNLRIKEVPEFVFMPLHGLVELQLERNKNLTLFSSLAFGQEVLQDADNFPLERLSLKGSRLTKLDEELAEPLGQLIVLDLQGNPWRCDCALVWLKALQIQPEYYEHLRCAWPKPLYNGKIFELDSKYFPCTITNSHIGFAFGVAGLCATLAAIALWMFVCVPKFHTTGFLRNMQSPVVAYSLLPVDTRSIDGY